ncbi:MAG: OmpA family protein [Verrucomicrobiota bacterium]
MAKDKSFDSIRLKATLGLFIFSLMFLLISVWLIQQHAHEQKRLGQVLGDNRQLVENQRLLLAATDQLRDNMAQQATQLKTKSKELRTSEQERLLLEKDRMVRLLKAQGRAERVKSIRRALAPALEGTEAQIFLDDQEVTIRLPGQNLFLSAEALLQQQGKEILDSIALVLSEELKDLPFRIEGHTDNIPIGESLKEVFPTNWHLSSMRASSAAQYLVDEGKIAPSRIEVVGRGAGDPIADNATPEGQAQNRRMDIVIRLED